MKKINVEFLFASFLIVIGVVSLFFAVHLGDYFFWKIFGLFAFFLCYVYILFNSEFVGLKNVSILSSFVFFWIYIFRPYYLGLYGGDFLLGVYWKSISVSWTLYSLFYFLFFLFFLKLGFHCKYFDFYLDFRNNIDKNSLLLLYFGIFLYVLFLIVNGGNSLILFSDYAQRKYKFLQDMSCIAIMPFFLYFVRSDSKIKYLHLFLFLLFIYASEFRWKLFTVFYIFCSVYMLSGREIPIRYIIYSVILAFLGCVVYDFQSVMKKGNEISIIERLSNDNNIYDSSLIVFDYVIKGGNISLGDSYWKALLNFVPRSLVGNKYISNVLFFIGDNISAKAGYAVNVVAESIYNLGIVGALFYSSLIGFLYGKILSYFSGNNLTIVAHVIASSLFFYFTRGYFAQYLSVIVFYMLPIFFLCKKRVL